ncbi:MAG: LysR family transcriptional regulator [Proteobacteria bacterium]|nr:LysR family transcriptional regulator [Pseudomonadota bacterium]
MEADHHAPTPGPATVERGALDRIELKQLEHVVEICNAGSFSGAARRLGLSQPALSKSISRLEAQLGMLLFKRAGGAARPTELGALIAERGRALLDSSMALNRELEQRSGRIAGRLRIAVGPATRLKPLPQVVRGVMERYPDLKLEIRLEDAPTFMRGVDQGKYDLAFGVSDYAEPYGELIRVKIYEDRTIVVARPEHPAAHAPQPLTPSELLRFPMASVGITTSFGAWIGELTAEELENARALVCNDFDIMQHFLPPTHTMRGAAFVFEQALADGELVEVPITWDAPFHCWMLTTPENWRLPVVKAVADIARETA